MGKPPLNARTLEGQCPSSGSTTPCSDSPSTGPVTPCRKGESGLVSDSCNWQLKRRTASSFGRRNACRRRPLVDSPSHVRRAPSYAQHLIQRKLNKSSSSPASLRKAVAEVAFVDSAELESPRCQQYSAEVEESTAATRKSNGTLLQAPEQRKGFANRFRENISAGAVGKDYIIELRSQIVGSKARSSGGSSARSLPGTPKAPATPNAMTPAFETWRLEYDGMSGAVRVSEFAAMRPLTDAEKGSVDAYKRPSNKRDLGHRCKYCRRPFSALGVDLVAGPEQGPSQRFHPECWRKHHGNEQQTSGCHVKSAVRRCRSEGMVGTNSTRAERDEVPDVVTSYVDEWKRTAFSPSQQCLRRRSRGPRKGSVARTSPLDGLVSVQDECGGRHVARGFSNRAVEIAESQWKCMPAENEECAVCLTFPEHPLRLPCGHMFCTDCVVPWLKRCSLCPLCRKDFHGHADIHTDGVERKVQGSISSRRV